MPSLANRLPEVRKYSAVYATNENYRMGDRRKFEAMSCIAELKAGRTYLDVGCGRGEMVEYAESIDLEATGIEPVLHLCDGATIISGFAHDLPFESKTIDYSSMFDVLEHLLPGDDILALQELKRVTKRRIILTANNQPSKNNKNGDNLHINIRKYSEWDEMIRGIFKDSLIIWQDRGDNISETWIIDLI